MRLILLSLNNIRRNITRSLAAVMGMAVASAMLTGLTAMSTGYAVLAYQSHRSLLQGDIVVYSGKWSVAGGDAGLAPQADGAARTRWELVRAPEVEFTDLTTFYPGVVSEGALRPVASSAAPFSDQELRQMEATEGVAQVYPLRMLPCLVQTGTGDSATYTVARLRGRNGSADAAYHFGQYVSEGRAFVPQDAGTDVAMIIAPKGEAFGSVGDSIRILVPHASGGEYDYSSLLPVSLEIVGKVAIPTWTEMVVIPATLESPAHGEAIQHYWETLDVLVPDSTLAAIYAETGGSGLPPAYQVGVSVTSMFDVRTVVPRLTSTLPRMTAVTVPEMVERSRWESGQPTVPLDLSRALLMLGYLAAGFLVMANMYVLVGQRLHELGVLRAIGASGGEVFRLILTEIAGYSLLGSLLGYLVVRAFFSVILTFTDVGLLRGSVLTLTSLFRVVGATVGVSVLFGIGPALYAARASTAEVLGNNG